MSVPFRKTFRAENLAHRHITGEHKAVTKAIMAYYAELPQWTVDAVWQEEGETFVQVSPAGRAFYEPPDLYVYKATLTPKGLHLEKHQFIDGTHGLRSNDQ